MNLIPSFASLVVLLASTKSVVNAIDCAQMMIDDPPPACVTPSTKGDDQRACGSGAQCLGGKNGRGSCDQRCLESPSCVTDDCNQEGASNPNCIGGGCNQKGSSGDTICVWGCDQSDYQGGGSPDCVGGNCCWSSTDYPGSCAHAPKKSNASWGCNPHSKSCRRHEEEEANDETTSYLRPV